MYLSLIIHEFVKSHYICNIESCVGEIDQYVNLSFVSFLICRWTSLSSIKFSIRVNGSGDWLTSTCTCFT